MSFAWSRPIVPQVYAKFWIVVDITEEVTTPTVLPLPLMDYSQT